MNKFDHDLNTFFALIFHEISLSAMPFICLIFDNLNDFLKSKTRNRPDWT